MTAAAAPACLWRVSQTCAAVEILDQGAHITRIEHESAYEWSSWTSASWREVYASIFMRSWSNVGKIRLITEAHTDLAKEISMASTKVRYSRLPRPFALVCLHTVVLNAARLALTAELYVRWNAETVILYMHSVLPRLLARGRDAPARQRIILHSYQTATTTLR
jgi:hypothetical protein